ncbi:MAG: hypothetical protein J7L07_07845 [Candidatus Odinarchaeota archaeon]|nr:hypothetical protein [Candidatus Odinarchaeota archaeon]
MGILSKIKGFFERFTKVKPLDVDELLKAQSRYTRPTRVKVVPLTAKPAPEEVAVPAEITTEPTVAVTVPAHELEEKKQELLKRRDELIRQREEIKMQMQELEKQYNSGVISAVEYDRQFAALLRQAVQIRRELSAVEEELMGMAA